MEGPVGRDPYVLSMLHQRSGSLLEYGFGAGSLLFHLARTGCFSPAFGVDISEQVIRAAERALARCAEPWTRAINLLRAKEDTLPEIRSASIDNIVCVATLEHVFDPYVLLDELRRIASRNAVLVCSVPNYAYLKHRITLLLGGLPKTGTDDPVEKWRASGWDGMHLHTFNRRAFQILLQECGWEPVAWTGWGVRAPWLMRLRQAVPSLFSGELIARCVTRGNR